MEEARFIFELVDGSASKPVGGGAAGAQAGSGTGEASKPTGAGERLEDRQQAAKGGSKPQTTPTPTPPASSTPKAPPLPSQPQGPQTGPTAFQVAKDLTGAIPGRFGADAYRILTSTEAALDRFGRLAELFKVPATVPTAPAPQTTRTTVPTAPGEAPAPPRAPATVPTGTPTTAAVQRPSIPTETPKAPATTSVDASGARPAPPKLDIEEPAPWEERAVFQTLDEQAAAYRAAMNKMRLAANANYLNPAIKPVAGINAGTAPMGTAVAPPVATAAVTAPAASTEAAAAGVGMAAVLPLAIGGTVAAAMAAGLISARQILADRAERYASISAPVAQARANNEVARTLQDIKLAREFGGNISDFSRATGRFERAINELSTRFAGNLAPTVTKLTDATAAVVEAAAPMATAAAQLLALGTEYGTALGPIAKIINSLKPGEKVDYGQSVFGWFAGRQHLEVPGWTGDEEKVFDQLGMEGAAMAGLKL